MKTLFKALLLTSFIAGAAQAGTMGERHEVMQSTEKVSAKVQSIDYKTRAITLEDNGDTFSFIADEDVKNLSQIKKGDWVNITYQAALAYQLNKGGEMAQAQEATSMSSADMGKKPEANMKREIKETVVITNIDKKAPSVTFKDASGDKQTVKVQHPERLNEFKVGDAVDITYSEALAVKVEKQPSKM